MKQDGTPKHLYGQCQRPGCSSGLPADLCRCDHVLDSRNHRGPVPPRPSATDQPKARTDA